MIIKSRIHSTSLQDHKILRNYSTPHLLTPEHVVAAVATGPLSDEEREKED